MISLLSTSKHNSTYANSRLSAANSIESFPGIRRSNTSICYPASNHSNQSNHLSGLSVLNGENYVKNLRIERINPETKTLKWASSLSDETESIKMHSNNDFISKNKEEVSNHNGIKQHGGKKLAITQNTRRKNNQNNLEDKILNLKLKDLERQQINLQMSIKRERYKLLDQFMESKAINMSFMQKKIPEETDLDFRMFKHDPSDFAKNLALRLNQDNLTTERYSMTSRSRTSYSSFQQDDLIKWSNFINQPMPAPKPNIFSKITERFIDQKIKYFPSYLRKSKSSVVTGDVDQALSKI